MAQSTRGWGNKETGGRLGLRYRTARTSLPDLLAMIPVGVRHGLTAAPSIVRVASRREAEMLTSRSVTTLRQSSVTAGGIVFTKIFAKNESTVGIYNCIFLINLLSAALHPSENSNNRKNTLYY
ncbi:hypothetical protein [Nostoc sp.]|uniref:hypothetical protein n=1 Tax=Nostoc sp. TaxID=1180 RepID=UPI002FFD32B3